jgi:hypothetical protein
MQIARLALCEVNEKMRGRPCRCGCGLVAELNFGA